MSSIEQKKTAAKRKAAQRADTSAKKTKIAATKHAGSIAAMFSAAGSDAAMPAEDSDPEEKTDDSKAPAAAAPNAMDTAADSAGSAAEAGSGGSGSARKVSDVGMVEEKPRADIQKSSGQGAAKWSKSWLTGDRKQWVKLTNNDQNAQCVWCMELLAAREKHGKAVNLGTSWATSGCTTRKESALISHETSEFHSKAAAAKADALGRLASKQDQRIFAAYEANFMVLFFQLEHRVRSLLC